MITKLSAALSQQIVNTIKEVCQHNINIINEHGIIIASTNEARIGTFHEVGKLAAEKGETIEVTDEDTYLGTKPGINMPLYYDRQLLCVVGITGDKEEVRKYANLAERIANLLIREQDINITSRRIADKKQYILQSLTQNKYDEEIILTYLKELSFPFVETQRILIIHNVKTNHESIVHHFFDTNNILLYATFLPNTIIAVVPSDINPLYDPLKTIAQTCDLRIGIGKPTTFFHLYESYQTAMLAIKNDKPITLFDNMHLSLLLTSLPPIVVKTFYEQTLSTLTQKEIRLLEIYYRNDMSLDKTAKQLFLHKNTLQYRLNHIYTKTNRNPRNFHDATLFYLAIQLQHTTNPLSESETVV